MRLDLSYTLFWLSLGISAVAVVLFLWLMRRGETRKTGDGRGETKETGQN